jgi:hypothetical protein
VEQITVGVSETGWRKAMATRRTGADAYHGKRFTRQSLVGDRQPRDKSLALGGGFGPLPRALAAITPQTPSPAPRGGGGREEVFPGPSAPAMSAGGCAKPGWQWPHAEAAGPCQAPALTTASALAHVTRPCQANLSLYVHTTPCTGDAACACASCQAAAPLTARLWLSWIC